MKLLVIAILQGLVFDKLFHAILKFHKKINPFFLTIKNGIYINKVRNLQSTRCTKKTLNNYKDTKLAIVISQFSSKPWDLTTKR